MAVAVVTDSTCDIPPPLARRLGIAVVPLNVHFGTRSYKDGVTITPDVFYSMLVGSPELPTTSLPSPGEFKETYDRLGEDSDGIVSIHISSRISGTYNSARQGAKLTSATCPVEVIDSAQSSMGLGLVVVKASEAANRGAGHDEVVALARDAAARAQCFCLFGTMQYLVKGGRVGKARGLLGSALSVKPMIIVRDGVPSQLGVARTLPKALVRMKKTARDFAPIESLAVMHSTTPELADEIATDLSDMLPQGTAPFVTRFGPALGVYAGPGAIAVAVIQGERSLSPC